MMGRCHGEDTHSGSKYLRQVHGGRREPVATSEGNCERDLANCLETVGVYSYEFEYRAPTEALSRVILSPVVRFYVKAKPELIPK